MTAPLPTTRKLPRPDSLISASREPELLELAPGDVLGQFKVERRLGRGGMNSVYLARHVTGGARVAIKVPNPELARDADALSRLAAEGRVLRTLRHPNIVTFFEASVAPSGLPYLVMEYLEGQSLSARDYAHLAVQPAVHVLSQLCDALGAFHAVGGVHRDVKPENIFLVHRLDAPMTLKLLDFGIARMRGDAEQRRATAMGSVVGTPDFMPPEQMMGEAVDARADLYAVGVIGHLLLTGTLPFANFREKMFNPPLSIRALRPEVPVALESALARALACDPAHRFSSALEFREALGAVLGARNGTQPGINTPLPAAFARPIQVVDTVGTELASCPSALIVPGGAWLCTRGVMPTREMPVLLVVPGHEGFIPARVVAAALFPEHVRAVLPRGFLVEFHRLETSARVAIAALAPK